MPHPPRLPGAAALVGALASAVLMAACSGSSKPPPADARSLLAQAKSVVDATPAVHFTLTSSNVTGSGTNITGGSGDLVRPDQMQGSFTVSINGLSAHVNVAAKGGVFEAELPFSAHYTRTNPASFGLEDPSQFLNPATGLTNLLVVGQGARVTGQKRVRGELLDEVTVSVPGSSIPVLPDANPSRPVTMVAGINPGSHQLRQVTLIGPFTSATSDATFVVTLTRYGETLTVTLPPAS